VALKLLDFFFSPSKNPHLWTKIRIFDPSPFFRVRGIRASKQERLVRIFLDI
jgi:hypothetical protein